jgi:hypothetical protein
MEKKEYIKIIEEYINYFSGNIPIEEYKNIGDKEKKNEEIDMEIYKELQDKCKKSIKGNIDPKEINEYASMLLYSKYNPDILRNALSDRVFDFLTLLDEFLFFKDEK